MKLPIVASIASLLLCFAALFANGQTLQANFLPDKSGGCSPLTVNFSNTTTSASPSATWEWDFGNGNISTLKTPAATFIEDKAYTIKLTVRDGQQSSVQTKTITVYRKPEISFTVTPAIACGTVTATLSGLKTGGDGNVSTWHWDFGDGTTQQTSGGTTSHIYNFIQTASVSLTAVSNYGCSNTAIKENAITVKAPLKPDFVTDKTFVCDLPGTVQFTNTSTGPGILSHRWDFGDGSSSADASPAHVYSKQGIFTVKLTVTSSEGCVETITRTNLINVREYTTDFTTPNLICEQRSATFSSQSAQLPSQSSWFVNNVAVFNTYSGVMYYTFPSAGTYTIKLVNKFGSCEQEQVKQVVIHKNPSLKGFVADIPLCGAPATVGFRDTTTDAVKWKWNFDYYTGSQTQSTQKNPTFTYNTNGYYFVRLEVENTVGCVSAADKSINISKKQASIFIQNGALTCVPAKVSFGTQSTEPITGLVWNFGDGTTSTEATPEHTYTGKGNYAISLNYVNADGCPSVANYLVEVKEKPKANFQVQSEVCGNTPVIFANTSVGNGFSYRWQFGDNTYQGNNSVFAPMHQYYDEGEYTVQLIAYSGLCADTITKVAAIRVKPPFPKINYPLNTCEGNRGTVNFTQSSRQAESWAWSFDNGPAVSFPSSGEVSHSFTTSGYHKAVLATTNGSCTVKDSIVFPVFLKPKAELRMHLASICPNQPVTFSISGLSKFTGSNGNGIYYTLYKFEYEDGTPLPYSSSINSFLDEGMTGQIFITQPSQKKIRAILISPLFNCYDTTNAADLIVNGPQAGFEILTKERCNNIPVVFRDTSKSSNSRIVSWRWDFGDGQTEIKSQGGEVSHLYAPGRYRVTLTVTDALGCSTQKATDYGEVIVTGVKASFTIFPGDPSILSTPVYFSNSSVSFSYSQTSWLWDFGNGITSTTANPSYIYPATGTYNVKLTATDLVSGCSDIYTRTVTIANPSLISNTIFIGNGIACPPAKANFNYTLNVGYTTLHWDFGDGAKLEGNNRSPSHIYTSPGTYIVTLNVYVGTSLANTWKDTVRVSQPTASFSISDLVVCKEEKLTLFSTIADESFTYAWDFGNGYIFKSKDSSTLTSYPAAGTYIPSLIITDAKGCSSAMMSADKITVPPDPAIAIIPVSPVVCKGNPAQLEASGAQSYEWSPANGLSNYTIARPLANPASTTTYSVTGTDINGCKGQGSVTVKVPRPFSIQATGNVELCKGSSVQLNAKGADSYLWINNVDGLSNTNTNNPVAKPAATVSYTVVGYDEFNCYTDTVVIPIRVNPLPVVNAGSDLEVLIGSPNQLHASGSADIVRWQWTPTDYLSCSNCASPIATPRSSVDYIVTATTNHNCTANDTIKIKTLCLETAIHIPSAFTPNNDGVNDKFVISANITKVISLQIFNRWGEPVFAAKDFIPGASSGSWNGRYKGADAPSDTYVYIAVFECQPGTRFEKKGTVTLLR